MFDTMHVAQQIKNARIAQNMTQMNLADAMEVSYQAVSNWERGNSMPDISKLEPLCSVLHISMDELLGVENGSKILTRIMHQEESDASQDDALEPITMEEIENVAPLIPPNNMKKLVDDSIHAHREKKPNFSAIVKLAPFLGQKYLDELVTSAHIESLNEVRRLAPCLSKDALDSLVKNANLPADMDGLTHLAPFLHKDTLDDLVMNRLQAYGIKVLRKLLPFLSKQTLDQLALNAYDKRDEAGLRAMAPFLSTDTMNELALEKIPIKNMNLLRHLAPFMSQQTLTALADKCMEMPHADKMLSGLYPFLPQSTLIKLAQKFAMEDYQEDENL